MRKVVIPTDQTLATYRACISSVADNNVRAAYTSVEPLIVAAADEFEKAVKLSQSFNMPDQKNVGVGPIKTDEMIKVYSYRLVQTQAGREIYDRIILAPQKGVCPICDHRDVSTLDHYVPKTHYPALVVTPINLVPSCWECNFVKRTYIARRSEEETIHPYFDDVQSDQWLAAEVIPEYPPTIKYYVKAPLTWDTLKINRVENHLVVFDLYTLYSTQAGSEMSGIEDYINELFNGSGGQAVRDHLLGTAKSRAKYNLNSWIAALYSALAASDWYCSELFEQ